jgi:hypothetical protein
MKYQLLIIVLLSLTLIPAGAGAGAANISGKWDCIVETPKPINVKFVFEQDGAKLSGTYTNKDGVEYPVTGTVEGNNVVFSYELTQSRQTMKVRYTGTIASHSKMTGAVEWIGGGAPPGKWTATKKK